LICGLSYATSCRECRAAFEKQTLPLPTGRQLWAWLCDRVTFLRRWRGANEAAVTPVVTDEFRANLLATVCDTNVREALFALLAPGIAMIARQSGGES
jgi:hypothetical protein